MNKITSKACILTMILTLFSTFILPSHAAPAAEYENRYDVTTARNCYVREDGTEVSSANFFTSDYIPVSPGETLYLGPCDPAQGYQFAVFDAAKNGLGLMKSADCETVAGLSGGGAILSYVVPEQAAYIRMSAAVVYARWFLLTRDQPFDEESLLRAVTAGGAAIASNLYDKTTADYGYRNADHSVTSSASHWSSKEFAVAANDTIFFGPCNENQNFQLYAWNTAGTASKVNASGLKIVDRFDNGQVIYAYRCLSDGTVSLVNASAYNDYYLATKNQPLTVQLYYNYWDSRENANCYFPTLDKTGAYLNNDGSYTDYANHSCSHYIAVQEGDTLTFGPAVAGQGYHAMGFDAEKTAVTGKVTASDLESTDTFSDGRMLYTYTVPAGISYVRVVNSTSYKSSFVIFKNNPITVEDYNNYMGIQVDPSSPLYRKTALFVGDSICYGSQDDASNRLAWAGRIAQSRGMLSYVNSAISGTSLSTARAERQGKIVSQLTRYSGWHFDYVILHGGVNDAWDSYPVGEMSDSFDPADFDLSTYAGGLEELIYNAIKYYGKTSAIGYLMNFKAPGCSTGNISDMSAYFAVGKQICEKWGIAYYDMYNSEEISEALKVTTNTYLPDYIHLNAAGYDIIAPYIGAWMETLEPYDSSVEEHEKTVIACVGDSITKGEMSNDVNRFSYPAQLQDLIGDDYEVLNLGWGGATAQTGTGNPFKGTYQYKQSLEADPDIVVMMFGHNDTKAANWDTSNHEASKAKFKAHLTELVQEYQNMPSQPTVYIATPAWAQGPLSVFNNGMLAAIREVAQEQNCTLIDVHAATFERSDLLASDAVHFTDEGYALIAETVREGLGLNKAEKKEVEIPDNVNPERPVMRAYSQYPEAGAYALETVEDVEIFGDLIASGVTFKNKTVYLMNDLDFSGKNFRPLGSSSGVTAANRILYDHAFQGTFNGNGHTFSNVYISSMWWDTALFPVTYGAVIQNFGLAGGRIEGLDITASIVGYGDGGTVLENVWSAADVYSARTADGAAGIAANMRNGGTMTNVAYYGTVSGTMNIAGLCSWGQSGNTALTMKNCVFAGNLDLRNINSTNYRSYTFGRYGATVSVNENLFGVIGREGTTSVDTAVPVLLDETAYSDGTAAALLNACEGARWVVREGRTVPGAGILRGDADGDGLVSTADAVRLMRYLNGHLVELNAANADFNGDGRLSIADAVAILRQLAA